MMNWRGRCELSGASLGITHALKLCRNTRRGEHPAVIAPSGSSAYFSTVRLGPVNQFFTETCHQMARKISVPPVSRGA